MDNCSVQMPISTRPNKIAHNTPTLKLIMRNGDTSHGDLPKLKQHAQAGKRMMDFIIPDRNEPKVIIESSYMTTTSSGQGDKSKVELSMRQLIKKHYPKAHFWGFVDGIGWYVRQTDLRRMVEAYEDVFTFREDEIVHFRSALEQIMAEG